MEDSRTARPIRAAAAQPHAVIDGTSAASQVSSLPMRLVQPRVAAENRASTSMIPGIKWEAILRQSHGYANIDESIRVRHKTRSQLDTPGADNWTVMMKGVMSKLSPGVAAWLLPIVGATRDWIPLL